MGSTRTYTIVSQDCIFQYIWVKWASWGPVTVKIFTGTFIASGTSLTAPGSNRTRRVTSVPIASVFLNLSITRNTITLLENFDGFFYWCEDENSRRQKTICSINTVQLWSSIPQYARGKGILKQLILIQCFCINQLYFSPLPLVDSWLKYSVWDSTASSVENSTWQKLHCRKGERISFPFRSQLCKFSYNSKVQANI